ncbi:DMT family transporter [Aestuariirhabdus litorea]|uniref:DMT family transporter n=1 Tax=Aestuariirhabdus litorea TaxID=2528527 RepID=A0A3P3VPH1_9GAMM|nr:DMT family transporter [Aestuariirhabdus litorea]RRJ84615.1 DMT family transporter [Aestuariirhabdus litorea]RWW97841.1 DMT family transporter [Endozoicomonadaceae bacterium GTF-13]
MTSSSSLRLPTLALLCAVLLWSSSFIALKFAFESYTPMVVIFARMVVATCCFILLLPKLGRPKYRKGDWRLLVGMAAFEPCLYFIFEAYALANTSAAQAGMISATLPLLVALGAYLFLKEKITPLSLTGFVIAVSGSVWLSLSSPSNEQAPNPMLGNFLEFMAMACAAGYTLILKHLSTRYRPLFLTAVQALIGALFFFPLALMEGMPTEVKPDALLAILYLGVIVTLGAYGLFNYAVGKMPASLASSFINLMPLCTALMAMLILDERFSLLQVLAAGLVLVGVFVGRLGHRSRS